MFKKPFPLTLQHDSMECGIACLSMICKYHGREYSTRYLAARVSVDELRELPLPCILHWNQQHFVVLYRIGKGGRKYDVADPGKGLVTYRREEFQKHWISTADGGEEKGIAMFLEPTEAFQEHQPDMGGGEKRSFGFLLGYLSRYRKYFLQIFMGLLLGCLLQLVMPFLTQSIVDVGIAKKDIGFVWLVLLGELMIVIGRTATDFIRRWLLLHISMRINISLLSDFFIKLLKLPMAFFDTKLMGDLLQRMGDHGRVQTFLTSQVLSTVFSLLGFLVFGLVLFIYNRLIFLVFLAGSALYGLWIATFLRRRKVLDYELFEQQAINQEKTYQFITSMQEIKLQDCERRRRWEWEDTQADLFQVQMKSLKLQQTQEAGSVFINEVKNILVTVLAATAVINGHITLGAMLAIQYIVGQLNSPVEQLMQFIYSLQDVKISLERINEIHQCEEEPTGGDLLTALGAEGKKEIRLEHLDFKYDPHALRYTLKDISFTIPAGKTTAIVGTSGSGKTTLVKLMLGYYPPLGGRLLIAGRDIARYDLKWWRRQCGAVMQDGVIFSESIARNIAVDDGEIDVARLEEAARVACIHDYVMKLPLKYNTKIGRDGVGLSQGQKQRILIARAVYKHPDFIFLDEATNSLDAKNERMIVENLEKFYQDRTVVVVAHRLSTVRNAHQIIVVDEGKIVETGTHEELIARKGAYYNLVKNQLELGT